MSTERGIDKRHSLPLGRSHRFPTDREMSVYRVAGGPVELYLETAQARTFLECIEVDEYLFAISGLGEANLLVIGQGSARLDRIDNAQLAQETLLRSAQRWMRSVAALAPAPSNAHRLSERIEAETHLELDASQATVSAAGAPLWIALPANGSARLSGIDTPFDGPAWIPLAGRLQVNLSGKVEVLTYSSQLLEQRGELLEAIGSSAPLLLELAEAEIARQVGSTLSRLGEARSQAAESVRAGERRLGAVASSRGQMSLASSTKLEVAALAVAYVLDDLKIEVAPKRLEYPGSHVETVIKLAHQAALRVRLVSLPDGWWRGGLGSLVGAFKASGEAVALLDQGASGYLLMDPSDRSAQRVDAALAAELSSRAIDLQRPLPSSFSGWSDAAAFVLRESGADLGKAIAAGLAVGLLTSVTPLATALIVDTLIPGAESGLLAQLAVALGVVALVIFALSLVRALALERINGRSHARLQAGIWDRLLRLPSQFFREYTAGDLAERVAGAEAIREAVLGALLNSLIVFVFSLVNLVLMFVYAPALALLALCLVLIYVAITLLAGILQVRQHRVVARLRGVLTSRVFEMLQGIMKLRVAGAEAHALARWSDTYAEQQLAVVRAGLLQNRHHAFQSAYPIIALGVLFACASYLDLPSLSAGVLIAFLAAYAIVQNTLLGAASSVLAVLGALPQWERLQPILDTAVESDGRLADPGQIDGRIEVNGLSFSYGAGRAAVLDGINLTIEPGQCIAIVGGSGSGKSTLLRLLLGFEKPTTGTILYDNQDLQSLDPALLRRQIGAVLQTGRLFSGTILDNIRGAHDLAFDECLSAVRAAGLEADLSTWPMGLYTPITEGGLTLSGGQQQRILIARALAAKPRLLFLDEATSALDNRTQQTVMSTFENLGVTRLIIAHRLSTVQKADCIHLLADGRFVESGTYDDLMALNRRFAHFARRQIL